jgi:hypothetical protein
MAAAGTATNRAVEARMVNRVLRIEGFLLFRRRVLAATHPRGYEEEESGEPETSRDPPEVSLPTLPDPLPEPPLPDPLSVEPPPSPPEVASSVVATAGVDAAPEDPVIEAALASPSGALTLDASPPECPGPCPPFVEVLPPSELDPEPPGLDDPTFAPDCGPELP